MNDYLNKSRMDRMLITIGTRPLHTLSIQDYVELNRKLIEEATQELRDQLEHLNRLQTILHERLSSEVHEPLPDEIGIDEVMEITRMTKAAIYSRVAREGLPVVRRKAPLLFSRKEILEWMRMGRPAHTAAASITKPYKSHP